MLDETEFLSRHGVRALSRIYKDQPYRLPVNGSSYTVAYEPAESTTGMFGGDSNWRGPKWLPVNVLVGECGQELHHYVGEQLKVEFPTRPGSSATFGHVSH